MRQTRNWYSLMGAGGCRKTRATKLKVLRYSRARAAKTSVRPVMTTRAEHLRQLARKCALKAAGAKDLAMKASLRQEHKQLLMLAEQAEKDEQNRMELPPRGLTKK